MINLSETKPLVL